MRSDARLAGDSGAPCRDGGGGVPVLLFGDIFWRGTRECCADVARGADDLGAPKGIMTPGRTPEITGCSTSLCFVADAKCVVGLGYARQAARARVRVVYALSPWSAGC